MTSSTERLFARLSPGQLEASCYHRCRAGTNGSARWNLVHRLVEVAYHAWDLERSLGLDAVMPEQTAAFLLPTLLEDHLPTIYQKEPSGEGRIRLNRRRGPAGIGPSEGVDIAQGTTEGWVLAAGPERLAVTSDGVADVTITASASVLALLIYGRADLFEEARQGRAEIEGDRAVAERFHSLIPPP